MTFDRTERDRCARRILALIREERVPVGGRLPGERVICRRLAATRHLVRLALAQLEEKSLIERRRQSGSYLLRTPREDSLAGTGSAISPSGRSRTISLMAMSPMVTDEMVAALQMTIDCGYLLHFYLCHMHGHRFEDEREYLELAIANRYRGVAIHATPRRPAEDDLFERAAAEMRLAHVGFYGTELPRQSFFLPDYRSAGASAVGYLLSRGCTRLHYVSGLPEGHHVNELILAGAKQAAAPLTGAALGRTFQCGPTLPEASGHRDELGRLGKHCGLLIFSPRTAAWLEDTLDEAPPMVLVTERLQDRAKVQMPAYAFDWMGRVRDALNFIMSDETAQRHHLYPPTFLPARDAAGERSRPLPALRPEC